MKSEIQVSIPLTEERMQSEIMQHFHNTRPETRRCIWHVPNGGSKSASEGNRFKAMGLVPGMQDIHIFWSGVLHVIELKTQSGTVSPDQKAVHSAHAAQGLITYLVRDVDVAISLMTAIIDGECLTAFNHLISPYADPSMATQYANEAREHRNRKRNKAF